MPMIITSFTGYYKVNLGFRRSVVKPGLKGVIMSQHLEITKEIVLTLIENKYIPVPRGADNNVQASKQFIQGVCEAFETVYQTVSTVESKGARHSFD